MSDGRTETHGDPELEPLSGAAASFRVALPNFEGPLDLLLHLIREHKLDIFDIPIALITEKYVESIDRMRALDLDIAGEFLVMVATLMQIKSRLLLPRQDAAAQAELQELQASPEEQGDPRAELVRRLLEYQKYKEASEHLMRQDIFDRDVFPRRVAIEATPIPDEEVPLVEMSVYKLVEALDRVLDRLVPKHQHEVVRERVKLSDAIQTIAQKIRAGGTIEFYTIFEGAVARHQIIITFLAVLEMCRMKLIRVFQEVGKDEIFLSEKGSALDALQELQGREQDDYR